MTEWVVAPMIESITEVSMIKEYDRPKTDYTLDSNLEIRKKCIDARYSQLRDLWHESNLTDREDIVEFITLSSKRAGYDNLVAIANCARLEVAATQEETGVSDS